jgi:hypothetical protein
MSNVLRRKQNGNEKAQGLFIGWCSMRPALFVSLCLLTLVHSPPLIPQMPTMDSPIVQLGAFLGKWKTTGEMKDTAYSKARSSVSESTCNWSANHGFLICDQIIESASGPRNDLSIYTYNEQEHAFSFFGLSRNDHEPRATKLTIEGDLWTYWNEEDDNGKHVRFRTTNRFTSQSAVVWRSEYSEDGAHWILMGEGRDTRVK